MPSARTEGNGKLTGRRALAAILRRAEVPQLYWDGLVDALEAWRVCPICATPRPGASDADNDTMQHFERRHA